MSAGNPYPVEQHIFIWPIYGSALLRGGGGGSLSGPYFFKKIKTLKITIIVGAWQQYSLRKLSFVSYSDARSSDTAEATNIVAMLEIFYITAKDVQLFEAGGTNIAPCNP